jgi:hypothetical protein
MLRAVLSGIEEPPSWLNVYESKETGKKTK